MMFVLTETAERVAGSESVIMEIVLTAILVCTGCLMVWGLVKGRKR